MTLPTAPSRTMDQDTFDTTTDAFIGALPQFETDMNALASAMTLNATTSTSATSNSVGAGSKSFTVGTSKSFWPGMWLLVSDTSAPSTNYMLGTVTSYNSSTGALVFSSTYYQGSGTKTAWSISQSGPSAFGNTIGVGNATPASTGAGVTFPATMSASSDANTLDDYEEGTWTGVATGSTSGTRNSIGGTYRKIGDTVTVKANWAVVPGELVGNITITGLPFTSSATSSTVSTCPLQTDRVTVTGSGKFFAYLPTNSTILSLYEEKTNASNAVFASSTHLLNASNMSLFLTMEYTT